MQEKFLLDSNIFIQSHNLHYHPSFCDGFWDWISVGYSAGIFFSIDKVWDELVPKSREDDELAVLLKSGKIPKTFFMPSLTDGLIVQSYQRLMDWADKTTRYQPKAIKIFQDHKYADAFLIATAMAHNYTIVTQETSGAVNSIKIPDAAKENGVKCMNIQQLLRKHAEDNFQLKL